MGHVQLRTPSVVYFLFDHKTRLLKVGRSVSVRGRVAGIRTANGGELKLIGTIPGGPDEEHAIHVALGDWHERGEWFRVSDDVVQRVRDVCDEGDRRTLVDQLERSLRALGVAC